MFTADSRTEKFLDTMGVKWKYTNDMTLKKLEHKWCMKNLGRSHAKIQGAIQEYGALMDKGSAAPAPILWRSSETNRHEVLDGIQRLLAEELRKPVNFSAYVVSTDSVSMVRKIRVFANYRLQGGYQESSEWTLQRAVNLLVDDGSMSVEEVADMGGWTLSAVRDKKIVMDTGNAIRGVGGPEKMADTLLRVISKQVSRSDFSDAPGPIASFTDDIRKMRLSAAEAEPYIDDFFAVNRQKGKVYSQFAKNLADFRSNEGVASRLADPSRRRHQSMSVDGKVMKAFKSALTMTENALESNEQIHGLEEYFQVLGKIKKALHGIERLGRRL